MSLSDFRTKSYEMSGSNLSIDYFYDKIETMSDHGIYKVYKARDRKNGQIVCLKQYIRDPTGKYDKTLGRQVSAMKRLHSPYIVNLLGIFNNEQDKSIYLITEYYEYTLERVLQSFRLTPQQSICIITQLLKIIDFLQQNKVLHLNISPSKIFISNEGKVKLGGFDHAIPSHLQTEEREKEVGTAFYKSPEIIFGYLNYTFSTDIWSAGCVIYNILTSKTIFKGKSPGLGSQYEKIVDVLADPSESDRILFSKLPNSYLLHVCTNNFSKIDTILNRELGGEFAGFRDLLKDIFKFNPNERATARSLLIQYQLLDKEPIKFSLVDLPIRITIKPTEFESPNLQVTRPPRSVVILCL